MKQLEDVIEIFSKLPGLGPRSARKIALHFIKKRHTLLPILKDKLDILANNVHECKICGNYGESDKCDICKDDKRDKKTLCIVNDVSDVWAIERTKSYNGIYHVLGGLLSAIDGITPSNLKLDKLILRVQNDKINEVIFALPVTIEGQTTLHYIAEILKPCGVKITMLALGIPVGGELDYLDDGTILNAIKARNVF
ncbi:MAG: Recombination protein RecR [Alphaproteobacteria bacterium ADurb.Bin438]|nr:MAG: Recombination protein RecR [Alphaproteobacteria bacterium ADurb.Bin438]